MKTKTTDVLIDKNIASEIVDTKIVPHEIIDTSYYPMVSAFRFENELYVNVCLLLTIRQLESLEVIEIIENTNSFRRHFNINVIPSTDPVMFPYPFSFCVENDMVMPITIGESVLVTVTTLNVFNANDPILTDPKTRRGTEVTVQSSTH